MTTTMEEPGTWRQLLAPGRYLGTAAVLGFAAVALAGCLTARR
jgi:hypothetical protein